MQYYTIEVSPFVPVFFDTFHKFTRKAQNPVDSAFQPWYDSVKIESLR